MMGIIEKILKEHYGEPQVILAANVVEYRWNQENEAYRSIVYKSIDILPCKTKLSPTLLRIYGDAIGGSLLLGSVRVASLGSTDICGLYTIEELQTQREIIDARSVDNGIDYFMDSSNVWYYGVKQDELYVYDSDTGELDKLGPLKEAMSRLLEEWEQAKT